MQLVSRRVIWVLFVSFLPHAKLGEPVIPKRMLWVSVWDVSNVVYFETAFSSVRASSIWSYAYVAMAAVVIVSPVRASDS